MRFAERLSNMTSNRHKRHRSTRVKALASLAVLFILGVIAVSIANIWIENSGKHFIWTESNGQRRDFAIVLGASVYGETLSGALHERMMKALELRREKLVGKVLLTGDGTDLWYNETSAMERFALRNNVPREDLFIDQEGYNTQASLARARSVFGVTSAYIISQDYHLTRAIWIARSFGIDAIGMPSNTVPTALIPALREILVRTKDFYSVLPQIIFSENEPQLSE